jgi:hypothetical protein
LTSSHEGLPGVVLSWRRARRSPPLPGVLEISDARHPDPVAERAGGVAGALLARLGRRPLGVPCGPATLRRQSVAIRTSTARHLALWTA